MASPLQREGTAWGHESWVPTMVGKRLAQGCSNWGQGLSVPRDARSEMRLAGPLRPHHSRSPPLELGPPIQRLQNEDWDPQGNLDQAPKGKLRASAHPRTLPPRALRRQQGDVLWQHLRLKAWLAQEESIASGRQMGVRAGGPPSPSLHQQTDLSLTFCRAPTGHKAPRWQTQWHFQRAWSTSG